MATTIRDAVLKDAPDLARVHVESWRSAYRDVLPKSYLDGLSEADRLTRWQEILKGMAPREFVLVAEQGGAAIGFVSGGPERSHDPDFPGEIYSLYVLAEQRGFGVGTRLFCRAVDRLVQAGLTRMKVRVLMDNPYRPFYERRGGRLIDMERTLLAREWYAEAVYGWNDLSMTSA